jgi:undecaprenyl-diphosphatase
LWLSKSEVWIALLVGLLVVRLFQRKWRALRVAAAVIVATSLTDAVCTWGLKPWFSRPRPCHSQIGTRPLVPACGSPYGMPSNHAANSAAISLTLGLASGWKRTWPIAVLGLLVGLSRVVLGVHYPGDVLLGFLVGALVAQSVCRLFGYRSCWRPIFLRGQTPKPSSG